MRKTEHNRAKPDRLRYYTQDAHSAPHVDREVRKNIRIFLGLEEGKTSFKYYRNLRDDIHSLTKGRCSYCGKYTELAIEHYRPKDGIATDTSKPRSISKPGYFWLASDWYNLHPACVPCNGLKTREILDSNTGKGVSKVVGKGNLFPLYGNKIHAPLLIQGNTKSSLSSSTKKVNQEKPLLLNPSITLPSDLFNYEIVSNRRGSKLLICAKVDISPYKYAIAKTTIDILGLNSKDQAKDRMDTYTLTKEALKNINSIASFDDIECMEQLAILYSYIDDSENGSYLGMIEWMFKDNLTLLARQIDRHLVIPVRVYHSLNDIVQSIDRLFDQNNFQ